jgi:two-component system LytT family response regulator
MIDAIIIDDEKNAIVTLKNDLMAYCPEVSVRAAYTKPAEAIHDINKNPPEVIFLDINMPLLNGFDFLKALDSQVKSNIIFVSAYSDFALRAFKVSAIDYLLKPINPLELIAAVEKIQTNTMYNATQSRLLKNFFDNYHADAPKGKVALPVNDGYNLVDPAHIIYCRADGAYTEVILDNEKSFLISKTLGRTQELLPEVFFERVHQSYLVNLNHIRKFKKGELATATMSNHDMVKVSRLNKDKLAQRLGLK